MPVAAGAAFVAEAAPADHGGLAQLKHPLGYGHAPQAFRAAAPFVTCEGKDVGSGRHIPQLQAAHRLGGVHQQKGVLGVLGQSLGHRCDGHRQAAVPQQVREHHKACAGLELLLQASQYRLI